MFEHARPRFRGRLAFFFRKSSAFQLSMQEALQRVALFGEGAARQIVVGGLFGGQQRGSIGEQLLDRGAVQREHAFLVAIRQSVDRTFRSGNRGAVFQCFEDFDLEAGSFDRRYRQLRLGIERAKVIDESHQSDARPVFCEIDDLRVQRDLAGDRDS
jgi:hypothetical protein